MRGPIKIPTALGIFLIIVLVVGLSFIFERASRQNTVATGATAPKELQITNTTDVSFSVVWMTDSPSTGVVVVSSNKVTNQTFFDERDTGGKLGKYITHSVSVRGRKPDSDHSIKILSDGKPFTGDGIPYRIHTPPTSDALTNALEPAYGTVLTSDNQPAVGAVVFITLEDSQTLSALVKASGSWIIPLNVLRTKDLSAAVPTTERMTETLIVRSDGEEATAITDTLNDSPVPSIVLGKTYDFRKQQAGKQTEEPIASAQTSSVLGEQTQIILPKNPKVSLTQPAQGDSLPTAFPLIAGTGIPGKSVSITLGISKPTGGSAVVAGDGIWRYTPTKPLQAGKQSVTITSTDAKGAPVAITHTFQILKSGTQVLGEATPSGTLTPVPTIFASSSASPIPTTTIVPISSGSSTLSGQEIPTSGTTLPTIILLITGFGLMFSGFAAWKFVK